MIKLPNVTLCAASSVEIEEHIEAFRISSQHIEFTKIKFMSDKEINEPDIEWVKCEEMKSRHDFNFFIVNDLPQYIDTDFVLIIHADGFVSNPNKWTDIFLEYDYIGAPWRDEPEKGFTGDTRVGNGGFSLRSKKLIDLPLKLNLPNRNKEIDCWNEDQYYSTFQRKILQEHGCKFAPLEVAKHFSHELTCSDIEGIEPFGFHGKDRRDEWYAKNKINL